ncbi:GNAT family N-acetyltransferase [Oceanospirillum sediminis]|uniref:GNAT family N-acetyltransferase n=1 Tax=Oceanospirillum sediminis TaxID=2760088 RepID=A0A839IMS3_9GAMM|nr:GNAT family N-acetyltransferase [Oceanospirillum sediminis]MBB1486258.1 GNAT family N-acetyltransferase [Oceanospirillum sediminis]
MQIVKANSEHSLLLADIISQANIPVAKQFSINQDNNPKHPSFYNEQWTQSDFERGEEYFICQQENQTVGCVAFEISDKGTGYLNRLSVLPRHQKQGIGEALVNFILDYAKSRDISVVSIGIIAEHGALRDWYLKLGFKATGHKQFPHLPFNVTFMAFYL